MGGQSLALQGTAITLDRGGCKLGRSGGTYRITGGTRWRDVLASLEPLRLSPKVMQSDHDFGVAASVSVNAHRWPAPHGPCGSTVRAVDLVLADGTLVRS
jgi:FAD/FMN-containing dehydrogenase